VEDGAGGMIPRRIFGYQLSLFLILFIAFFSIGIQSCSKSSHILPNELLDIYGGIDLGQTREVVEEKMAVIESKSEDGYVGYSRSNRNYNLNINTSEDLLFRRGRVYAMWASFTNKYIESGIDTSLAYWINNFTKYYNAGPKHFYDPTYNPLDKSIKRESYTWQFPLYSFDILRITFADTSKNTEFAFGVILTGDSTTSMIIYSQENEITQNGDTVKYNWKPNDIIKDKK
jgi:hypothetical protein